MACIYARLIFTNDLKKVSDSESKNIGTVRFNLVGSTNKENFLKGVEVLKKKHGILGYQYVSYDQYYSRMKQKLHLQRESRGELS